MNIQYSAGLGIVAVLAIASWAPPTRAMEAGNKKAMEAGDKEAVRQLSNEADSEFEAGRDQQALEKFQRAYESAKVPTLLALIAKTQVKLGHLVEAYEAYHQATILEPNDLWVGHIQQDAQRDAQRALDELQPRIPRLTIRIEGANPNDVTVKIDDADIPSSLIGVERLSDPGQRRIVGHLGNSEVHAEATLSEGERKEVLLKFPQNEALAPKSLPPAPLPPNPAMPPDSAAKQPMSLDSGAKQSNSARTWGWVSVGVGATGLALGATTGIVLAAKHGSISSDCPNNKCERTFWSDAVTFNTLRYVSAVGFIVGGIGTAAGITLLATNPKQESKPRVGFWLTPTSAGAEGTF